MQLTGGVTALVCSKDDAHCSEAKSTVGFAACAEMSRPATSGAGGGPLMPASAPRPMFVRLCLGEGQGDAKNRRTDTLERMAGDPDLDAGPTFGVVLATEIDIILRCRPLRECPMELCFCVRSWFPITYPNSAMICLATPKVMLDMGFGLQLQRPAFVQRDEAIAIQWMKSGAFQVALARTILRAEMHSLVVERVLSVVERASTNVLRLNIPHQLPTSPDRANSLEWLQTTSDY